MGELRQRVPVLPLREAAADMTFDDCTTVRDIDARYHELWTEQGIVAGSSEYWALADAHRRAHEAHVYERDHGSAPVVTERDPDAINSRQLRNWAAKQGIGLAVKGKVPKAVQDQYRRAHEIPVAEPDRKLRLSDMDGVSNADVRAWAREHDIAVGERGRVHPDVIAAYAKAHP